MRFNFLRFLFLFHSMTFWLDSSSKVYSIYRLSKLSLKIRHTVHIIPFNSWILKSIWNSKWNKRIFYLKNQKINDQTNTKKPVSIESTNLFSPKKSILDATWWCLIYGFLHFILYFILLAWYLFMSGSKRRKKIFFEAHW